jgi:feruloyl esterase
MKPQRHLRQRRITILGNAILIGTSLAMLGAPAGSAATAASDPAAACVSLANLANFPVTPTQITSAQFNPAGTVSANGVPLPAHCQIDGIINKRTGSDGYPYGDGFEVRLPTPADWNGRLMFQGGGGTEGSVPPATGTAGTL